MFCTDLLNVPAELILNLGVYHNLILIIIYHNSKNFIVCLEMDLSQNKVWYEVQSVSLMLARHYVPHLHIALES